GAGSAVQPARRAASQRAGRRGNRGSHRPLHRPADWRLLMTTPFAAAFAVGDIATLAQRCLAQLPSAGGDATLGILYVSEPAAPALPQLVRDLAAGTGITSW